MKKVRSPHFTYPRFQPPERAAARKNEDLPRLLCGHSLFSLEFARLLKQVSRPGDTVTVLDLCTGSGTFARLAEADGARWGRTIRVAGIDFDRAIADLANSRSGGDSKIHFAFHPLEEIDKLRPQSYDLVLCCYALHLFPMDKALLLVKAAEQLAAKGWLLLDLQRSRLFSFFLESFSPWLIGDRAARRGALQAAQQAFTPHELKNLAFHAAIDETFAKSWLGIHQALIRFKK